MGEKTPPPTRIKNTVSVNTTAAATVQVEQVFDHHNSRSLRLNAMLDAVRVIAHKMRSPFGSINIFAQLLERELAGKGSTLLQKIISEINRADDILADLLQNMKISTSAQEEVELHILMKRVIEDFHSATLGKRIELKLKLNALDCLIEGDKTLLEQLLLHLLLNALQAVKTDGILTIETRNVLKRDKKMFEMTIKDNGCGIEAEELGKVFDPFFTSQVPDIGLGLTRCHFIVDSHRGALKMESKLSEGTQVTIFFPVKEQ